VRRTILITTTTLFTICAGLWIGGITAVGAFAAPAAFQALEGMERGGVPVAGEVVGAALRRFNAASVAFLAIMVAVSVFEAFYRKRRPAVPLLWARLLVVLAGFALCLYVGQVMMPAMEGQRARLEMDAFGAMHARYRGIALFQALLGALSLALTAAVNIGPRRDGGHPRVEPK